MDNKVTLLQAYKAMFEFLSDLYFREGQPNNLGGFLGSLRILDDGTTADPAAWEDWVEKVEEIIAQEEANMDQ